MPSPYNSLCLRHIWRKNMNEQKTSQNELEDIKVNVKLKLAALWTCFMFLYIYVDYFGLYMHGYLKGVMDGKMWVFDITQTALLLGLISVSIPAIMIVLSALLNAKISRITNIVVATIYIPYSLFNLVGEAWKHMMYGAAVEVVLLVLVINYAWKWPRVDAVKV